MSIKSIFTDNHSQATSSPANAQPREGVKEVSMRDHGDRAVPPVGHTWAEFFLNGPRASEDFMAERATPPQAEREAL